MSRSRIGQVRDLELRFLHQSGGTDVVGARRAWWREASDDRMGQWGADINNPRSRVAGKVKAADEVEFWARIDDEQALSRVFIGVLGIKGRDLKQGGLSEYDVNGLGYEAKLQLRHVTRSQLPSIDVGTLIHEVMGSNDIDLTLSGVASPFGVTVSDMVFDYVDWHEFLTRLAGATGCGWHVDKDRVLHWYLLGVTDSGITETGSGGSLWDFTEDSETVVNIVRGFGGTSKVQHAAQTSVASYATVTGTISKGVRVLWPREEIPLVEVWARSIAGSSSALELRIESDNAGSPSGVPLARYIVQPTDIPGAGGWLAAFPSRHFIGPGTYVHVIVQGTTPQGVEIGQNATSDMAYRAYVGYPIATEVSDSASITAYGKREGRAIRDSDITSLEDLTLRLNVHLTKFSRPLIVGRFEAKNAAYLVAALGSFVTVTMPDVDTDLDSAELTIKEREHTYENHQYRVRVLLADGEREREAGSLLASLLRRLEALEASSLRSSTNVLQLLTASDTLALADTATIAATATGGAAWDADAWDFMEWS